MIQKRTQIFQGYIKQHINQLKGLSFFHINPMRNLNSVDTQLSYWLISACRYEKRGFNQKQILIGLDIVYCFFPTLPFVFNFLHINSKRNSVHNVFHFKINSVSFKYIMLRAKYITADIY